MENEQEFYSQFAEYYDSIFPLHQPAFQYIHKAVDSGIDSDPDRMVLDIGCGTGSMALALSNSCTVTGIDLDSEMIGIARKKGAAMGSSAAFYVLNMLGIAERFEPASFGTILCLGNTIAHLDSAASVLQFFTSVKKVLKPGGTFILQGLNYSYILDNEITRLPDIIHENTAFYRNYRHTPPVKGNIQVTDISEKHTSESLNSLFFVTKLTVNDKTVFTAQTPHNPLRPDCIAELVTLSDMCVLNQMSDYAGGQLKSNALPCITIAMKHHNESQK